MPGPGIAIDVNAETQSQTAGAFDRLLAAGPRTAAAGLRRIVMLAQRDAKRNAPISPTRAQRNALRTTRRRVTRKARATHRPSPGGLVRSIEATSDATAGVVFVPANAEAGKYARRIHDEKGISWQNRGPGTIAKGPQADAKFIERAVVGEANAKRHVAILEDELKKAAGAAWKG